MTTDATDLIIECDLEAEYLAVSTPWLPLPRHKLSFQYLCDCGLLHQGSLKVTAHYREILQADIKCDVGVVTHVRIVIPADPVSEAVKELLADLREVKHTDF